MKITGPAANPRITDFTLNVPLFGSTEYNAVVHGSIDLSTSNSWPEAQLRGNLTLERIDLKQLGRLQLFEELLPPGFTSEGTINIYSQFEGSWEQLRLGALIRADKAAVRYRDWFHKAAGTAARMQIIASRQKHGVVLHPALLGLGASELTYTGSTDDLRELRLRVRLYGAQVRVATWSQLFSALPIYGSGGELACDVTLSKNLGSLGANWDARGRVKIIGGQFRHKASGRKIDNLNADILVSAPQARVENASFYLGSSRISLTLNATDYFIPESRERYCILQRHCSKRGRHHEFIVQGREGKKCLWCGIVRKENAE